MRYGTLLVVCTLALACPFASADTFNLNATGNDFNATAVLTATPSGTAGVDNIIAISGEVNGQTIAGLEPATGNGNGFSFVNYFSVGQYNYGPEFDNLLFTTGQPLDEYGVAFTFSNGNVANIYNDDGSLFYLDPQNYTAADVADLTPGAPLDELTVAAVTPEPSSFLLLGTGALALAGVTRRRTMFGLSAR